MIGAEHVDQQGARLSVYRLAMVFALRVVKVAGHLVEGVVVCCVVLFVNLDFHFPRKLEKQQIYKGLNFHTC